MAWPASIPTFATGIGGVTVSKLNDLRDALKALGDSSGSYTTTWDAVTTSPALGNGSLAAAYSQQGKKVQYRIVLTMGSTTTYGSGAFTFTLPVATTLLATHAPVGIATLFDSSANTVYTRNAMLLNTTTIVLRDQGGTTINATTPVTTANGDRISIIGSYEIA